jgi:hypothetical protein
VPCPSFDGNRYCVPARYVGDKLIVKADASSLTIYDQLHEIVCYPRSWQRGQTFGAERFEKELQVLCVSGSLSPSWLTALRNRRRERDKVPHATPHSSKNAAFAGGCRRSDVYDSLFKNLTDLQAGQRLGDPFHVVIEIRVRL